MNPPLRLLVISPSCVRVINRAVFRELAKRGVSLHLVVPWRIFVGGRWMDTEQHPGEGYDISHLEMIGTHGRLQRLKGLRTLVKQVRPTHVYVDADPGSMLAIQAAWAAPRARVCAITAENLPPETLRAALRAQGLHGAVNVAVKFTLRRHSRPRLDRVFTLSEDGSRVAQAMGFKPTKLPLGYDPALFNVQSAEKRAATRAHLRLIRPTIAYFGRQVPEKGVHVMLDALAQIRDLEWQLLMDSFARDSAYARQLDAQLDRLALRDRTVFFSSSHEDMPDYMNAADLVVLPSVSTPKWKEQYGRIIQEAQACGRVLVASDSGAIAETMDGHGHLVPEGDATALAARLRALLEQGVFEDLAAAASARQHRSIERQADIIHRYLQESTRTPRCNANTRNPFSRSHD